MALFLARDQFNGFSGSSGPSQSTTTRDEVLSFETSEGATVEPEPEDPGGIGS